MPAEPSSPPTHLAIEVGLQRLVLCTLLRKLLLGVDASVFERLLLLLQRLLTVSLLHREQETDADEHQWDYE
jgi:hypothetical protein